MTITNPPAKQGENIMKEFALAFIIIVIALAAMFGNQVSIFIH